MTDSRVDYVTKRFSDLENKRKPWEPIWDKAAQMCSVNSKIYTKDVRGRIVQNIFDSTGRNALTGFVASMKSILVPSNSTWHRLKPENPALENNDTVKRYLDYVNKLLFKFRYAPNSNFSSETDILLQQIGIYGQGPWMVEDNVGKGILYRSVPMSEIYCAINNAGKIDVVYRCYEMSYRNAVKEFGSRSTSKMREKAEKTPDENMRLLQAVEPRQDRDLSKKDYRGMEYVSYNIDLDNKELIYESGYRTQPYMIPHYLGIPGEAYGDSPALQAFFDLLTINEMGKTVLRSGQLQANPAILTFKDIQDASRLGSPGAIIPGGLDEQGKPRAAPMQYANNMSISLEMQNQVRSVIEQAFLKPLFQSLSMKDKQMTAEEARQIAAEKAMLLAPMGERISSEWLIGNTTREIDILASYGLLDEVPDELLYDGALQISFESPIVHMQESSAILGLYKTIESAMSMAQVDPAVLDKINFGNALDVIADYEGVPTQVMRSPEEVVALGEMRAQREQAAQLLEAAPVLSQSMKNLGINGAGQ